MVGWLVCCLFGAVLTLALAVVFGFGFLLGERGEEGGEGEGMNTSVRSPSAAMRLSPRLLHRVFTLKRFTPADPGSDLLVRFYRLFSPAETA